VGVTERASTPPAVRSATAHVPERKSLGGGGGGFDFRARVTISFK
jgi:hypothetical protein